MKTGSEYGEIKFSPEEVVIDSWNTFVLKYTVGEKGLAQDCGLQLMFRGQMLGFSRLQTNNPSSEGYVTATTNVPNVKVKVFFVSPVARPRMRILQIKVVNGNLVRGDELQFVIGDRSNGGLGFHVGNYPRNPMRLAVLYGLEIDSELELPQEDSRHLGIYISPRELACSPQIKVVPDKVCNLVINVASIARPGEEVKTTVVFCDQFYNPSGLEHDFHGNLNVNGEAMINIFAKAGCKSLEVDGIVFNKAGIYRLNLNLNGKVYESNPVLCDQHEEYIYWGDMHVHSNFSDGEGTPEELIASAKNILGLDFMTIVDHADNLASPFIWTDASWRGDKLKILSELSDVNSEEGKFIVFQGYEWCGRGGDRIVYSREVEKMPLYHRRMKNLYDVQNFYKAIRKHPGLIIASHPHGIKTNWNYFDEKIEHFAEIASIQGESEFKTGLEVIVDEANSSPHAEHRSLAAKGVGPVQTAFECRHIVGVIGAGDMHYGVINRKTAINNKYRAGLAAIKAPGCKRDELWKNLLNRCSYGTNGEKIILRFSSEELRMGEVGEIRQECSFRCEVNGTAEIDFVDLVKNNVAVTRVVGNNAKDILLEYEDSFCQGDFNSYYIRVHQKDGGKAWSSPIWRILNPIR
jgi:hypothetical protein